ncbi:MAG: ABC transporter permease [Betaproteobacteria bacterium]
MRTFDRIAVLVALVAAWHAASLYFGAQWITTPWVTAQAFWRTLLRGDLWHHGSYTLSAAVLGFLIGGIPGAGLPFVLRRMHTLRAILDPYLVAGYGAPKVALTPLFIIWFGIGLASKVALVASVVFFLVFFVTSAGLASVDQKLIAAARVFGADARLIAREIVWPSAAPYVFTGLRIAAPYAIGTAVVGELISSNRGLGYSIQAAATDFDPAGILVGVVALALVVTGLNAALGLLESRLLAWRPDDKTVERAQAAF